MKIGTCWRHLNTSGPAALQKKTNYLTNKKMLTVVNYSHSGFNWRIKSSHEELKETAFFFFFMSEKRWLQSVSLYGFTPCVSPSRAPVLSFARYFQAPVTQATMWHNFRLYTVNKFLEFLSFSIILFICFVVFFFPRLISTLFARGLTNLIKPEIK